MKHTRLSIVILVIWLGAGLTLGHAQKYSSEKSFVSFFSDASIEDIKAENSKSASLINTATGDIVFSIPIKDFEFEKSLMKEHFNEKYMETEKFPKATFQGKLTGLNMNESAEQQLKAVGKMSIHGVTKEVEVPGTIQVIDGKILAKAKFMVKLADYKVKIPQLLWKNIAEEVEVTIEFTYKAQ